MTCLKTIYKYKAQSVQAKITDCDDDSAFEDELLISAEKNDPKGFRIENLQKLHNLIVHDEDQEFDHFCQEFEKESLEKMNPRGFNSLHLSVVV